MNTAMANRLYETTIVFNGTLEDDAVEQLVTRVTELISTHGGEITFQERIGRRRLVYPIKKRTNGYYLGLQFKADNEMVKRMEKMFKLDEQVLRYLTLQIDEKLLRTREDQRKRAEARAQAAEAAKVAETTTPQ
jgi:small subunit ribosomal protein S6